MADSDERESHLRIRQALRHDLRNPLAVILGRCEMLVDGALGELAEPQQRSVEIIRRNATRMVEMLDDLATRHSDLPEP